MQLRTWILVVAGLVVVWRWQDAEPVAKATPSVRPRSAHLEPLPASVTRARAIEIVSVEPRDGVEVEAGDPGEDVEDPDPDEELADEIVAAGLHDVDETLGDRGAVRGRVLDSASAEPMAGVTIVVTFAQEQVAITDDQGRFEIRGMAPGEHTVAMYFADHVESHDVVVNASRITPLYAWLAWSPAEPHAEPPVIEEHGHGITIDPVYTRDIVTARHFEDDDMIGVSFSGVSTLDNVYVIE